MNESVKRFIRRIEFSDMSYREPLPEGCPPEDAEEISSERFVYRLVRTLPPTADDFFSQRARRPDANFQLPECRARGLSVHDSLAASENLRKLRHMARLTPCRVRLDSGAGRILQTGQPDHYTWWPLAAFDVLAACESGNA